jgi:anhydro-N-acetylmuramic acid kinase
MSTDCEAELYIGLMSGTSLDGVDAVLAAISPQGAVKQLASYYQTYPEALRQQVLDLHTAQPNEIDLAQHCANVLARLYAETITLLLQRAGQDKQAIRAIGCHGQTVRHRPDAAYTLQLGNAALLAELTEVTVVADFRSRDIAAGGQGAPLVPAFHAQALRHARIHRVIVNLGGIANVTDLPPAGTIRGWDTGPGNMLMDAWIKLHRDETYDKDGSWAATGHVQPALLSALLAHPYRQLTPPKSAGREQFNLPALQTLLAASSSALAPVDVQATLLEFTAQSLCRDILRYCQGAEEIYLCGGGAHNARLSARIAELLDPLPVASTATLGIDPDWMEALAFAWLARQTLHDMPGNLPEVTGACGARVLGAIYPA